MGTLFLEYFYHDVVIKDILYDLNGSEGANSIIFTLNNNEECDEDTDNKWSVELVGTFSFDKDNDDWACDEVFTTRDHPFVIECESDWKLVETFFIGLVNEYLSSGKYAGKLKEYQAIGIGFVDGDLQILYAR